MQEGGEGCSVQLKGLSVENRSHSLFGDRRKDEYVQSQAGVSVSETVFATSGKKFCDLDIHKYLVSNLEKHGFTSLTNVQEKSVPVIMSGKDVLVRGINIFEFQSFTAMLSFFFQRKLLSKKSWIYERVNG